MKFKKAGWIKFRNKLLPRYYPDTWKVKVSETKSIMFSDWEHAQIFEKLLELEKQLRKGDVE